MESKKQQVLELDDGSLSVDEICVKVGCAPQYVYQARDGLKRGIRLAEMERTLKAVVLQPSLEGADSGLNALAGLVECMPDKEREEAEALISSMLKQVSTGKEVKE